MAGRRPTRSGDDNPKIPGSSPSGNGPKGTRVGDELPSNFGWSSPRWREERKRSQKEVEKERRDHDKAAPMDDPDGAIRHERDKTSTD